ncbi:hypothetical protein BDW71DRAFT_211390 [Aspergillus fruticulosus]
MPLNVLAYKDEGSAIVTVNLDSGMGGKNADLTFSQGAEAVVDIVTGVKAKNNG